MQIILLFSLKRGRKGFLFPFARPIAFGHLMRGTFCLFLLSTPTRFAFIQTQGGRPNHRLSVQRHALKGSIGLLIIWRDWDVCRFCRCQGLKLPLSDQLFLSFGAIRRLHLAPFSYRPYEIFTMSLMISISCPADRGLSGSMRGGGDVGAYFTLLALSGAAGFPFEDGGGEAS